MAKNEARKGENCRGGTIVIRIFVLDVPWTKMKRAEEKGNCRGTMLT